MQLSLIRQISPVMLEMGSVYAGYFKVMIT